MVKQLYGYMELNLQQYQVKMNEFLRLAILLPHVSFYPLPIVEAFKNLVTLSVLLPTEMTTVKVHFTGFGCKQQDGFKSHFAAVKR